MYVAMPEIGIATVVPYTLQVRGCVNASVQVGTYGEVSSVLEVERFQKEPVAACFVLLGCIIELYKVLRCHCRRASQLQVHTIHQFAVCSLVVREQRGVSFVISLVDTAVHIRRQCCCRCSAHATVFACIVIRCGSHDDVHPRSTAYAYAL